MLTREPLHVAFVWHMHQPYYRSSPTGPFQMPWARLHALKDYGAMVELLGRYPDLHQTFNLVPSLVEQLETYATGVFTDLYWDLTLKPAEELEPAERAFVVERMCEASSHPRASRHPHYRELAKKRDAHAPHWETCAQAFTAQELRDLQVWFNLAWFPTSALEAEPLRSLVAQGSHFEEAHKSVLATVQAEILSRVLPLYKEAAQRGQVELSTSPYFHPILPLLANSDLARLSSADTILPRRRFAHPEDAWEQIELGIAKHLATFGHEPAGMWCPEQAVGEDVLPLLLRAGISWTISDELVLNRSLTGAEDQTSAGRLLTAAPVAPELPYDAFRLPREEGELSIVFRDHTLSDLIGFTYHSWNPRDAAADMLTRLRTIARQPSSQLVTIALDGENPWDHYQRNGEDFLRYLYEGLLSDPQFRCVTVTEHLQQRPPVRALTWLHTGSWIGGDLRTWSGDPAHNVAWDLLHDARDLVASRRLETGQKGRATGSPHSQPSDIESAWHHILVAEGSDWFWWFGIHHHTELDHVWDQEFRRHLQEAYRAIGEPAPARLLLPILDSEDVLHPLPPRGFVTPSIDGVLTESDGWDKAGRMAEQVTSTMQRAAPRLLEEVRFALDARGLWLLLVPEQRRFFAALSETELQGVVVTIDLRTLGDRPVLSLSLPLKSAEGRTDAAGGGAGRALLAVGEVIEIHIPLAGAEVPADFALGLELTLGGRPDLEQVFHTRGLNSLRVDSTGVDSTG